MLSLFLLAAAAAAAAVAAAAEIPGSHDEAAHHLQAVGSWLELGLEFQSGLVETTGLNELPLKVMKMET